MATVRFYGDLRRFGDKFKLEVRDAKEALRLLFSQIDGLKKHIEQGFYKVRVKGQDVLKDNIEQPFSTILRDGDIIHIVPVIAGAKSGNFMHTMNVVVGGALIAAAFFTGNIALGVAGIGMLLGGVAGLLTPTPDAPKGEEARRESTTFSSLENLAPQGRSIPVVYGQMMIGSLVVSQGLNTRDV